MATQITITIEEELGDLSIGSNGWKKQLSCTCWYGREPKSDIRSWDENHEKMTEGIMLTKEGLLNLKEILNNLDFDKFYKIRLMAIFLIAK
ncbi:YdbC family protein [Dialister micraerophilus]|uniref:YdbC family protein n=1 Tax=Dialister micraerophilus TaxID=309120 RepID=UPI0023F1D6C0|nr:PC4/YdbC family ssDNA-binding protein [Dialister micraerophilus]